MCQHCTFHASGCTAGSVVTHSVSIYDGTAFSEAITRLELAGGYITDNLVKLFTTTAEREQTKREIMIY